jgi:hypothetical protein
LTYGVGHKPNISHFFIFGGPAFVHIPIMKNKLNSILNLSKASFVGYGEFVGIKGYMIYDFIIFGNYYLITMLFLMKMKIFNFGFSKATNYLKADNFIEILKFYDLQTIATIAPPFIQVPILPTCTSPILSSPIAPTLLPLFIEGLTTSNIPTHLPPSTPKNNSSFFHIPPLVIFVVDLVLLLNH